MPTRSPTRVEALERWREGILRDCRVAMPGVVQKYDPATQLADVQPLVSDIFPDEDDSVTSIRLPVITNVPVKFCGGGGFRETYPIAAGDVVELLFQDRSIDAWLALGSFQDPQDERRHHLSDAIALAGLHDNKHPWTGARTDAATWGKDGGPQVAVTTAQIELGGTDETVACAGKVVTELNRLWAALASHTHPVSGAVAGASTPTITSTAGSVASSLVKVKS